MLLFQHQDPFWSKNWFEDTFALVPKSPEKMDLFLVLKSKKSHQSAMRLFQPFKHIFCVLNNELQINLLLVSVYKKLQRQNI